MAKHKKSARVFVETSAAIFRLHGSALAKDYVRERLQGKRIATSWFVRMEYMRAFVVGLIELYFVIKGEDSVEEALSSPWRRDHTEH
jgi:hypothetical protein